MLSAISRGETIQWICNSLMLGPLLKTGLRLPPCPSIKRETRSHLPCPLCAKIWAGGNDAVCRPPRPMFQSLTRVEPIWPIDVS